MTPCMDWTMQNKVGSQLSPFFPSSQCPVHRPHAAQGAKQTPATSPDRQGGTEALDSDPPGLDTWGPLSLAWSFGLSTPQSLPPKIDST